MKISKFVLLWSAAVAAVAGSASATTTVHYVGSTAFRAATEQAIYDYLTAQSAAPTVVFKNASPSGNLQKDFLGAGAVTFSGTLSDTTPVVVECYWTGSLAGDVDVALQNSNYTNKYVAPSGNTGEVAGQINELSSVNFDANVPADVAMSDSSITAVMDELNDVQSAYASPNNTAAGLQNTITNAGLTNAGSTAGTAGTVGVIPFELVLGNPGTTGTGGETASNIGQQALKCLATKGFVQFSELSGLTTDGTNFAVLVGRSEDSGTRIDSLSEAQSEEINNYDFAPLQVNVSFTNNQKTDTNFASTDPAYNVGGSTAVVAGVVQWPANYTLAPTQPNLSWVQAGHSGQYSGGDVANVLSAYNNGFFGTSGSVASAILTHTHVSEYTATKSRVSLIGYVGLADGLSATGNGAIALTYNGVGYSQAAVESGQYSLWGYEHMYYTSAFASAGGDAKSLVDGIADLVFSTDADVDTNGDLGHGGASAAGVLYGSMQVKRTVLEGEYIYNK